LIRYCAGQGPVRDIMKLCSGRAFAVQDVARRPDLDADPRTHALRLRLHGRGDLDSLMVAVGDLRGVTSVEKGAPDPAGGER
jgi:hypothetical protein